MQSSSTSVPRHATASTRNSASAVTMPGIICSHDEASFSSGNAPHANASPVLLVHGRHQCGINRAGRGRCTPDQTALRLGYARTVARAPDARHRVDGGTPRVDSRGNAGPIESQYAVLEVRLVARCDHDSSRFNPTVPGVRSRRSSPLRLAWLHRRGYRAGGDGTRIARDRRTGRTGCWLPPATLAKRSIIATVSSRAQRESLDSEQYGALDGGGALSRAIRAAVHRARHQYRDDQSASGSVVRSIAVCRAPWSRQTASRSRRAVRAWARYGAITATASERGDRVMPRASP